VHNIATAVVRDPAKISDIRRVRDRLRHPAARIGSSDALGEVHDGGTFVGQDLLVGVNADVEGVAELAGLEHYAGVAWKEISKR